MRLVRSMCMLAIVVLSQRVASASFVQQGKLVASDKTEEDQFGTSVAVNGDTALVGAPGGGDAGSFSGTAYIFTRDADGNWHAGQKLTASDGATSNFFGCSVALNGDIALIGARGNSPQGNFSGAAYVFIRDGNGQWSERQKLTASDGAAGNLFGASVALSGTTALIGVQGNADSGNYPGAAYVFTQGTDGQWSEAQKLTASDGAAGDEFGYRIALEGGAALIGARGADDNGASAGAAYVFTQGTDGQWSEAQKLTASDGTPGDELGYSVALSGDSALIGARFAAGVEESRAGAVYAFTFGIGPIGTRWSEVQKLTADDEATANEFGRSVALNGTTALVGALGSGTAGAVYVFTFAQDDTGGSRWSQLQEISARDGTPGDEFGFSIAFGDEVAFVGAPFDDLFDDGDDDDDDNDQNYIDAGAAYVLIPASIPTACTIRADYDAVGCSGTFFADTLADLDEYVANDFGRKDNNGKYKNLTLEESLDYIKLEIESPCKITIQERITLSGDFVRLDGRKGVFSSSGYNLEADKLACVLSEQDQAVLGTIAQVDTGALTIQAAKAATIGKNSAVNVDGDLVITSTGNSSSSSALINSGSIVTAGTITLQAVQGAQFGENALITADGAVSLISTGTASGSKAGMQARAQVKATDLTISSAREAKVGKNANVILSGNLSISSTGNASKSQATVDEGAQISVAGDAEIISGNKATLGSNTAVTVTHNLHLEAAKCTVKSSATVTAGSILGNCL